MIRWMILALLCMTMPAQAQWYFEGNDKPYPAPIQTPGGVYFFMGDSYKVEASYLLRRNGDIGRNATIAVTYKIETLAGTPDFQATECSGSSVNTGTVGIMLRRSTNLTRDYDRFWSTARVNLDPGTYVLTARTADVAAWVSVYGKTAQQKPEKFKELLNNIRDIALTFGGCSHYGHGVKVFGGNARFQILSVGVQ